MAIVQPRATTPLLRASQSLLCRKSSIATRATGGSRVRTAATPRCAASCTCRYECQLFMCLFVFLEPRMTTHLPVCRWTSLRWSCSTSPMRAISTARPTPSATPWPVRTALDIPPSSVNAEAVSIRRQECHLLRMSGRIRYLQRTCPNARSCPFSVRLTCRATYLVYYMIICSGTARLWSSICNRAYRSDSPGSNISSDVAGRLPCRLQGKTNNLAGNAELKALTPLTRIHTATAPGPGCSFWIVSNKSCSSFHSNCLSLPPILMVRRLSYEGPLCAWC